LWRSLILLVVVVVVLVVGRFLGLVPRLRRMASHGGHGGIGSR
jgi:hypothetical protein